MAVNALLLAESTRQRRASTAAQISPHLRASLDDNALSQLQENPSRLNCEPAFHLVGNEIGLDPPTTLCDPCKDFMKNPPAVYLNITDRPRNGSGTVLVWPPAEYWSKHHSSLFELIDCCYSDKGKCHLCQLIWHSFRRKTRKSRHKKKKKKFDVVWHDRPMEICVQAHRYRHDPSHYRLCINLPFGEGRVPLNLVKIWDGPGNSPIHSTMKDSPDSEETFTQVKTWIRECEQEHKQCRHHQGEFPEPPTRLIAVEDEGESFRLVTPVPKDSRYLALSYRWGRNQQAFFLSKDSMREMMRGASTKILPKTLRDACSITYRLGFQYLWVDRLCICQDSREDWDFEASHMAQVYTNAFCTIAASGAAGEEDGCFVERNALGIRPLRVACRLFPDWEEVFFFSKAPTANQKEGKLGHLNSRGWIFQEKNLSRRIVFFSNEQVHWECMEANRTEAWPQKKLLVPGYFRDLDHGRASLDIIPESRKDKDSRDRLWKRVIAGYSGLKFTRKSDKLPALSGIAHEVQDQMRDLPGDASFSSGEAEEAVRPVEREYFAGLWRRDMIPQLCWFTTSSIPPRPEDYRAPSWSWACIDTKANFESHIVWKWDFKSVDLADIKDVRVDLASPNPFGHVNDGWILLSAHLVPTTVECRSADGKKMPYLAFKRDSANDPSPTSKSDGGVLRFFGLQKPQPTFACQYPHRCFELECRRCWDPESWCAQYRQPALRLDVELSSLSANEGGNSIPTFLAPLCNPGEFHEAGTQVYGLLLAEKGAVASIRTGDTLAALPGFDGGQEYQRVGFVKLSVVDWDAFRTWLAEETPRRDIIVR